MKHVYYEGDDIVFRGQFEIDNVAQSPDAGTAKVRVLERGRNLPYLAETDATISGNEIYYKLANVRAGTFRLFFEATFSSGDDKRTDIIDFVVRKKVAN